MELAEAEVEQKPSRARRAKASTKPSVKASAKAPKALRPFSDVPQTLAKIDAGFSVNQIVEEAIAKKIAPAEQTYTPDERGKVTIEEFLYPSFNTRKLDGRTLDGRPYKEGVNLPGPRIPQSWWDQDHDRNFVEPKLYIEPGGRLVVGKQEQFYEAIFHYPEVFLGGAAGGSKSTALLKSHVVKHLSWKARGITGQNTAMFCETKEELLRRHIINLPKHLPKWLGYWDNETFIFHFFKKFGGGTIMFLYVGKKKTDIERLLSYAFAYVTIDELTRNAKYVYDFITSRLRSEFVPADEWCVASASNPGSVGHKWVYAHFVNTKQRREAEIKLGERRCFIQALANENPYLPKEYYEKILGKLPEKIRKAYRDGDWKVFEGQFFDMLDETVHIVPRFRIPDEITKYAGIDFGTSHPSGCSWVLHYAPTEEYTNGRVIVYRYFEKKDKWPNRTKRDIWDRMKSDKNFMYPIALSHDAFSQRQSTEGDLKVSEMFNAENEWGPSFDVVPSTRDRKLRWRVLLEMLSFESHLEVQPDGSVVRVIDRPPRLVFMDTHECRMLFDELAAMVHKDGDSEDCEPLAGSDYEVGFGDEGPDSLGYCLINMGVGKFMQEYEEPKPKYNDPYRDRREQEQHVAYGYGDFTM